MAITIARAVEIVPKKSAEEKAREAGGVTWDMSSIVASDDDKPVGVTIDVGEPKRKRGRPRKESSGTELLEFQNPKAKTPLNSEMSYQETFNPGMAMITSTINQIDTLSGQLMQDLNVVRNLRNSLKKYEYMGSLSSAVTSLISSRLSAVRELNSITSKCHDLELKRHKEINSGANEVDDDKRIMDLYSAYINNPFGVAPANMPYASMSQTDIMAIGTGSSNNLFTQDNDPGFAKYEANLTPQQNAMLNEGNPNIETVLVYDQSSQNKWFEVIDKINGAPVPNMPVPGDFILEGTIPDIRRGIARNADFNKNFNLKLIGSRAANEY